jgi:hypothetical protein
MRAISNLMALCVITLLGTGCRVSESKRSPLRLLSPTDWSWVGTSGLLLVRGERQSDCLLLTVRGTAEYYGEKLAPAYRYCPDRGALEHAGSRAWNEGADPVIAAGQDLTRSPNGLLTVGRSAQRLQFRGRLLADQKQNPVVWIRGCGATGLVAILTATRFRSSGPAILFWYEEFTGPYYHQLVFESDGTPASDRIRLPFSQKSGRLGMCTSADGRYVAYIDERCTELCIVPVSSDAQRPAAVR